MITLSPGRNTWAFYFKTKLIKLNKENLMFITEKQSQENFNSALRALSECNSVREVVKIGQQVIKYQQDSITGAYFFPKGKSKDFWAAYHKAKESFNASHQAA